MRKVLQCRGGVEFRIYFYRIFRIFFHLSNQSNHKFSNSNRTNFERIQHLKNLIPPYSWSRIESNEFRMDFYWIFRIIFHLSHQSNHKFLNRIERILNEYSIWKIWRHPIVGVEWNRANCELIFIEFFEYFLPFRINRIANFRIASNEFRTNSNLTPPL